MPRGPARAVVASQVKINEKVTDTSLDIDCRSKGPSDLHFRGLDRDMDYAVSLRESGVSGAGWCHLLSFTTLPYAPVPGELLQCCNGQVLGPARANVRRGGRGLRVAPDPLHTHTHTDSEQRGTTDLGAVAPKTFSWPLWPRGSQFPPHFPRSQPRLRRSAPEASAWMGNLNIALRGGGGGGLTWTPAEGGGGVGEMGFRVGPFVLCKNGCWRQRHRNTKIGPKKFFPPIISPPTFE